MTLGRDSEAGGEEGEVARAIDFLLIDDEPGIGSFIRRVADGCGFVAASTTDIDAFKRIYGAHPVEVIAVDLSMPGTDGVEVLHFLAETGCRASVLVISGFDRRVVEASIRLGEALGLRMAGIMAKPLRVEEVRSLLIGLKAAPGATDDAARLTAADLERGIENGELYLLYQPKIELDGGRLRGVEALARWRHPEHGMIAPAAFVPRIEQLGLIDRLTEWVLESALRQWTGWREAGLAIDVAVNISALSLERLDLPDVVGNLCAAHGVPGERLIIELTEGSTQSAVRLLHNMSRFRLKGSKISLDDYGTGYSSLALLQQLPFNEVKIDRCFVSAAVTSRDSRAILKSTINLAHELGMTATAEGVETDDAIDLLVELGCDQAQGYGIGPPLPGPDLPGWLDEWGRVAQGRRWRATERG